MQIEILERPAFAMAKLTLESGETITTESGSMVGMSAGLTVETRASQRGGGGLLRGLKRLFAGENFFLNHFTAQRDGAHLMLAPALVGDIVHHRLTGGTLIVQGTSWLASSESIAIDATWTGFTNALLAGESIFWVKCSGEGDVLLASFGSIYEIQVDGEYVVDTGHMVAFTEGLEYRVSKVGGYKSLFLSGEGLVCRFTGKGRIWIQTRQVPRFARWAWIYRPVKSRS